MRILKINELDHDFEAQLDSSYLSRRGTRGDEMA